MRLSYKFDFINKRTKDSGILIPLEYKINIPFEVKRIFYIYGVSNNNERGNHAYYNTQQVLICLSGSLKVRCFDGEYNKIHSLDKPNEAIYIGPHIWRATFEHSCDSVLLVLSSLEYDEFDYIRDYDKFLEVIECT